MENRKLYIVIIVIALFFGGCKHNHDHGSHDDHGHGTEAAHDHGNEDDHEGHDHEEGSMVLTKEQMATVGLEFGVFSEIKGSGYIKAAGTIGVPPNGLTSISPKVNGILKSNKKLIEGAYIKQGAFIGSIQNPEIIEKQEEFLQTRAELGFARIELVRARSLMEEQAGIEKDVQQLDSKVQALTARVMASSKYLEYLGINADELTAEGITDKVFLYAPISGYFTNVNFHEGMYAKQGDVLMEILSGDHMHLELDVFERDIPFVVRGQKFTYTVPALGSDIYEGEVHVIGREINMEKKTIRIHGHPEGKRPPMIKDIFIEAKIWKDDIIQQAVPNAAIVRDGRSAYIFAAREDYDAEEIEFTKLMVKAENSDKGYTAIKMIDQLPLGMKIVTKGAFFIDAQSRIGELAHDH